MIAYKEIQERAQITYRQVDYWTRCGWLRPNERARASSGHPRHYPDSEMDVALLLGALSALDMTGTSGGRGRGRRSDYLDGLIAFVRENGLVGTVAIGAGSVTIDLSRIGELAKIRQEASAA